MKNNGKNTPLWWAAFGFALLVSVWFIFFVVAAHHRVADVPLEVRGGR
jgi:hypothetical protein